jgi:cytidine deaminase
VFVNTESLIAAAAAARQQAYAPYSHFSVGAALLSASGRVYSGGNIENVSLGLTICAERVCVGSALQGGERSFEALAIVTDSTETAMPCGACRQVLAEFTADLPIISATTAGGRSEVRLSDLLPLPRRGVLESFHVEHG